MSICLFSRVCDRGLFVAALVHNEGRILVTGDDVVPMIDVSAEFLPATLSSDLYWLMKVMNTNVCSSNFFNTVIDIYKLKLQFYHTLVTLIT